jgi:tape measure domain-containing protein
MGTTNEQFLIQVKADITDATNDLKKLVGQIDKTGKSGTAAGKGMGLMESKMRGLVGIAAAYLSLRTAKKIFDEADAWNVLQSRIKTATKVTGDYVQVSKELYDITKDNGQQMDVTVALFQNLSRSAPELGATNREMLALTRTVEQLSIISGTTEANQRAGLLQFSQGLAGGVFRAEEFNSILENLPELANRIAKGMGLTVGQLRRAVIEGKVLSKDVFDAIQSQSQEINTQFNEMDDALVRASTARNTSISNYLAALDKVVNATQNLAKLNREIADHFDYAAQLLQESKLEEAQRKRLEAMVEYQTIKAQGFEEDDIHLEQLIKRINALDDLIKSLQPEEYTPPAPDVVPEAPVLPISQEEIKAAKDYEKSIRELTDRLDPASAATHKLEKELDLLNKQFFDDQSISGDRYDQLTDALLGAADAAKKANDEFDAMDRALDLIDEQFAALDEAEARQIAGLDKLGKSADKNFDQMNAAIRGWGNEFTNTLVDMTMNGELSFKKMSDAIIRDLLRIAIQTQITQPLINSVLPGTFPTKHSGGIAGAGGGSTQVNPAVFSFAPRYHYGGIAGLKPNEVPTVLERNEEVLPTSDPRHRFNLGSGGGTVRVEVHNENTPIEAKSSDVSFDGDAMVISVFTRDIKNGGQIDNLLRSTYKLNR